MPARQPYPILLQPPVKEVRGRGGPTHQSVASGRCARRIDLVAVEPPAPFCPCQLSAVRVPIIPGWFSHTVDPTRSSSIRIVTLQHIQTIRQLLAGLQPRKRYPAYCLGHGYCRLATADTNAYPPLRSHRFGCLRAQQRRPTRIGISCRCNPRIIGERQQGTAFQIECHTARGEYTDLGLLQFLIRKRRITTFKPYIQPAQRMAELQPHRLAGTHTGTGTQQIGDIV